MAKKTEEKAISKTNYVSEYDNTELTNYVKYSFYTLICIFVCVLITTIFIIILAVDNDKNNNRNSSSYSSNESSNNGGGSSQSGNNNNNVEYDVSMFTEITAQELINLYNGSERSVIYIGRETCGYCVAFLPSLQKAQEELGYKTYYYDIDKLTADDYYDIIALNSFLETNFGSTPMVIVVQNGKILSANDDNQGWVGYAEYETFKNYMIGLGF